MLRHEGRLVILCAMVAQLTRHPHQSLHETYMTRQDVALF